MSWTQTIAAILFLIALGTFIDTCHKGSASGDKIVGWIRSLLVWLFIKLEEIKPVQIAAAAFRVPVWLQLLTMTSSAVLVFVAGGLILALIKVLGKQPYPIETLYWTVGFAIVMQLAVFIAMRLISRYANDIVATIAILVMPFIFLGAIIAPISAANGHPGLAGLWLAIYLFCMLIAGSIPILLVIFVAFRIMALKYTTLLFRWTMMHIADGASSPKISPFSYFSALTSLAMLGLKTLSELL